MAAPPGRAALAHGTHVARLVLEGLPTARLLSAQVFHDALDASAADVAQAIAWLAAQRVDVINMSFGLRARSPALEAACRQAHEAGVLPAPAPARGGIPGSVRVLHRGVGRRVLPGGRGVVAGAAGGGLRHASLPGA